VITFLITSSSNVVFMGGGCLLGRGGRRVFPDVPCSPFRIFLFCSPWRSAPVCPRCFTLYVSGREGVCRRSPGEWGQVSSPPCRGRILVPELVVRGVLVGCRVSVCLDILGKFLLGSGSWSRWSLRIPGWRVVRSGSGLYSSVLWGACTAPSCGVVYYLVLPLFSNSGEGRLQK